MSAIHSEDSLDSWVSEQSSKQTVDDNDGNTVVEDGSTCDTLITNLKEFKIKAKQQIIEPAVTVENQLKSQVKNDDVLTVSKVKSVETTSSPSVSNKKEEACQITCSTHINSSTNNRKKFWNNKKRFNYGYKNKRYGQQRFRPSYYSRNESQYNSNYKNYNSYPSNYNNYSLSSSTNIYNKRGSYYPRVYTQGYLWNPPMNICNRYGPSYPRAYTHQELYQQRLERRFYLISKFIDLLNEVGI